MNAGDYHNFPVMPGDDNDVYTTMEDEQNCAASAGDIDILFVTAEYDNDVFFTVE